MACVDTFTQMVQAIKYRGSRSQILYLQWLLGPYTIMFGYLDPLGQRAVSLTDIRK